MTNKNFNIQSLSDINDAGLKSLMMALWQYKGKKGIEIVQQALVNIGENIKIDGWFGKKSVKALKSVPTNLLNEEIGGIITGNPTPREEMIRSIIKECKHYGVVDGNQIKYILATVQHETNDTFMPVVEAYWVRDKYIKKHGQKIGLKKFEKWGAKHFKTKKSGKVYHPYYGRGLVQITWEENYRVMSKVLSKRYGKVIDLVKYPELALKEEYAITILVYGMKHGTFTGKKLDDYITKNKVDFKRARKIINRMDKAKHIALLAKSIDIV